MNDIFKSKIMIFLEDQDLCDSICKEFKSSGWDVVCKIKITDVIQEFERREPNWFELLITGLTMNGIDADKFHRTLDELSPLTQKMIIASSSESNALVEKINTGNVRACITRPFSSEELFNQAEICLLNFKREQKNKQFKRLISRQNQQLYKTAKTFKQREAHIKQIISEKKAQLIALKENKKQIGKQLAVSKDISLERFIDHKGIDRMPETFLPEFFLIKQKIDQLLDTMAGARSTQWHKPAARISARNAGASLEHYELVKSIEKYAMIHSLAAESVLDANGSKTDDSDMENFIELVISDDLSSAHLRRKKTFSKDIVNLTAVLDFLRLHQITYGIDSDENIEEWLTSDKENTIVIAKGTQPVSSGDGKVEYLFQVDYTNPGKIHSDGSIDFRDRGDVPYVEKGNLLAKKTAPVKGSVGMDIFGNEIPVQEPVDPLFAAGSGTRIPDDGLFIFAEANGQPHVDAMGTVTVNQEIIIKGDVDFETGNINFDGNIVVKGTVKDSFHVKGVNLTANEIEGATIELTGDLNVSNGMRNTTIISVGNVHTKFINNCTIIGFGSLTVLKEIVDSKIILGGKCNMPTGHIIGSHVSAKTGIEARNIGTESSAAPELRVGFDDHVEKMEKEIEAELKQSLDQIAEFKNRKKQLKKKTDQLHQDISESAFSQDRAIAEIRQCEKQIPEVEASGNIASLQKLRTSLKTLKKKETEVDTEINRLFDIQDTVGNEIEDITEKISRFENKNIMYMKKKRQLAEFKKITEADPVVIVGQTIVQGTRITSPKAALLLKENQHRCTIKEKKQDDDIMQLYEMQITKNI